MSVPRRDIRLPPVNRDEALYLINHLFLRRMGSPRPERIAWRRSGESASLLQNSGTSSSRGIALAPSDQTKPQHMEERTEQVSGIDPAKRNWHPSGRVCRVSPDPRPSAALPEATAEVRSPRQLAPLGPEDREARSRGQVVAASQASEERR